MPVAPLHFTYNDESMGSLATMLDVLWWRPYVSFRTARQSPLVAVTAEPTAIRDKLRWWGTPTPKSIVILVNHHHDLHAALFLMKQADDARGGKCRPISPDQQPLQLFLSGQAIRRPRCGAATRADSLVLLIIHAVYFDVSLDIAKRARLTIIRGNQYPRLV
jgi:hypothetical protein